MTSNVFSFSGLVFGFLSPFFIYFLFLLVAFSVSTFVSHLLYHQRATVTAGIASDITIIIFVFLMGGFKFSWPFPPFLSFTNCIYCFLLSFPLLCIH